MSDAESSVPTPPDDADRPPTTANNVEFAPPRDFAHGEEFLPECPRPIPAILKQGSYASKRRGVIWTLTILGIACIAFHYVKMVQELSYYVLVLQYLNFIGYGLLGFAAVMVVIQLTDPGRFVYVRDGIPIVGKVLSVGSYPHGTAEYQYFKYLVNVAYRDPESNNLVETQLEADDAFPVSRQAGYELALEPGQYVTLVGLPNRFHETLRIYNLLGLDPGREGILRNGQPIRGMSVFTALLLATTIVVGMALFMSVLYTIEFCFPRGGGWQVPTIACLLGAVVGTGGGWLLSRREERKNPAGAQSEAGCLMICFSIFGAAAGGVVMALLNAKLDDSPPDYRPIEVVEFWEETWTPIFVRNYEIEYREPGAAETQKIPAKKMHMETFESPHGVIDVAKGRFGMTWIRGIHPLVWETQEVQQAPEEGELAAHDGRYAFVTFEDPATNLPKVILFRPRIRLEDGTLVRPPETLEDVAIKEILQEFDRQHPADAAE